MRVGGQRHASAALPPGKTRCLLYRRMGGIQSRSGRVRKISPLPGFDPRTLQPVASRYTDWALSSPTPVQIVWVETLTVNSRRNKLLLSCSSRLYPTVGISVELTRVKNWWNELIERNFCSENLQGQQSAHGQDGKSGNWSGFRESEMRTELIKTRSIKSLFWSD